MPGAVAVDVAGTFAYVAAGTNGLTIVDVTDRTKPRTRGTIAGIGNAQAVRASGQNVFVADADGFLRIVNAQNPDAPTVVASLAIPGTPASLAVPTGATVKLYLLSDTSANQVIRVTLAGTTQASSATVNVTFPSGGARGFIKASW